MRRKKGKKAERKERGKREGREKRKKGSSEGKKGQGRKPFHYNWQQTFIDRKALFQFHREDHERLRDNSCLECHLVEFFSDLEVSEFGCCGLNCAFQNDILKS